MVNVRVPDTIKNMTIGAGNQPGTLTTASGSETTISGSKVTADGLTLQRFASAVSYTTTLSGNGDPNGLDTMIAVSTINNKQGKRMFAIHEPGLYQDSISSSNRIPGGSNVNEDDYTLYYTPDWGRSDGNNLKYVNYVKNTTGSPRTVKVVGNWRWLVEEAE